MIRKDYGEAVYRIETAMEIIKAVRNIRAEADAAPGRKLTWKSEQALWQMLFLRFSLI